MKAKSGLGRAPGAVAALSALLSLGACGGGGGAEGLVRWSAQRCQGTGMIVPPADAGGGDAGGGDAGGGDAGGGEGGAPDASAPAAMCEARLARVANTVLPVAKPDPRVLKCYSRVTGTGADRLVEVGFEAVDASGGRLALRGLAGTAASATAVGGTAAGCQVDLTEGATALSGRCGDGCTLTITGINDAAGTVQGRLVCPALMESGAGFYWRVFNAEGVPGNSADFSLARCEAPSMLTR